MNWDAAPDLLEALKANAVRFPIEFNTTLERCDCNQFLDTDYCRHVMAMRAIEKAEVQQ